MKNLPRNKAFTLVEVLVAAALLVVIIAMAGTVFRVGIESQRMAQANAEIMQKFRAITDQLNADFRGLCKDGEIYITWGTESDKNDPDYGRHLGDDKIVFFTKGDFQSYKPYGGRVIRGNIARVSYMLGSRRNARGDVRTAWSLTPPNRVLQRTQHILTQEETLDAFAPLLDVNETATDQAWYEWHNYSEHDIITLQQWLDMNEVTKFNALSVATKVKVQTPESTDRDFWGSQYDVNQPALHAHSLLSEGVGEFKIQGWFDTPDATLTGRRWVPDEDLDQDGNTSDSEVLVTQDASLGDDLMAVAGALYSGDNAYAAVSLGGEFQGQSFNHVLSQERFNEIPGLGRALKFTFTLYDSKGLIRQGRTFTHIVTLDR
ncbi:MAG: prepilin-type N-terminal cleavage/methylation domain-containing protein [Phycisphaeraceae bacterium]|nr:prepilin-type N-terminal cleavage/methylation domain-containing protein [Phycisphaeraceae bacterium]